MKKVLAIVTMVTFSTLAQASTSKKWEHIRDESGQVVAIVLVDQNDDGQVRSSDIPKLFRLIQKALGLNESNSLCETANCGIPFVNGGGN